MNRLASGIVLSLTSATAAVAQEPVDLETIARIKREGIQRSQVLDMFNMLTNVIGPRLTATPGYRAAADWAVERLQAWGVEDVHLESWEFGRGWTLEKLNLEMTEPRYFPLLGYPEAWTPSTAGEIEATPIYIGDKTVEQLQRLRSELKGSIVLAVPPQTEFIKEDRPQPATTSERVAIGAPTSVRSQGPVNRRDLVPILQEAGVAAMLSPNQGEHGTIFVLGNRSTSDAAVPSVVLASEHYNMMVRMIQAGVGVKLRVNVRSRYHEDDTNGYNVIAEIPGVDPNLRNEVVMVGAHLDTWHSATGGTDNSDGVAASMEAMRILRAIEIRPRRTIRLGLWGGEEQGLLGARAWVEQHLAGDANREAHQHFSVYFNNDPGYGRIYGFYLEEHDAVRPIFDAWLEPLKDLGALRNVSDKIGSTDHVPFVRVGVPAYNAIQEYADYDVRTHHTNMDFYERLNEADLKQSAIVLATFLYHAAMRDDMIPRTR